MIPRIGVAILAGGASRRFGTPKQLAPWRGTTLVQAIAREVCASSADAVAVVLGAHAEAVAPEVAGLRCTTLPNPDWPEGIAASIRTAVQWATTCGFDALALVLCDQARLTAQHVDALCAAHRLTHRSIASYYADTIGAPAVFDRRDFAALAALEGDNGARRVLLAAKPAAIEWQDGAFDIDTPEDLAS